MIDEQLEGVGDEPGRVTDDKDEDHQNGGPGVTCITFSFLPGPEINRIIKNIVDLNKLFTSTFHMLFLHLQT